MLVLASQSPRRRRFLEEAGIPFVCDPAHGAEAAWNGQTPPHDYVLETAKAKANEVQARHPGDTVLAADTIVVKDHQIFGKPKDLQDAHRMLRLLSGARHHVLTAVAFQKGATLLRAWVSSTAVQFKSLTEEEIAAYCRLVPVLDKAGAYGIQDHGDLLVEAIDGLWSNVVGLPIEEVLNELVDASVA